MSTHVPVSEGGKSVCIHSVCVTPEWRKKGVALGLLKEYIRRLETTGDPQLQLVLLICHDEVIDLYRKAGFTLVGKSTVVHGPREWFEMKLDILHTEKQLPTEMQPAAWAALSQPSSPPGSQALRFTAFASIQNLVSDDLRKGSQTNTYKLVCPREGCGSLLLLKGVARLVEASSVQVREPPEDGPGPDLPG